jgi:hypothetical protein
VKNRRDPVVITMAACTAGALAAVAGGLALGSWRGGLALALGLLIGSLNGHLARGALRAEVAFSVTSMGRMAVLTVLGVGVAALLGLQFAPLALLGIGAAQVVLAVAAGIQVART